MVLIYRVMLLFKYIFKPELQHKLPEIFSLLRTLMEKHTGTTLQKFDDPDHIENIPVDRKSIPKGKYKDVGYESRQIVDIEISRIVAEYRAQILEEGCSWKTG